MRVFLTIVGAVAGLSLASGSHELFGIVLGALAGFAVGLIGWLAYRPQNEQSAHHLIPMFALPWTVIVVAMVLAVVATFFAAGHPARAITRVPVVSALAGRPAPPRQIHRSFVGLRGNQAHRGIVEDYAQLALILAAELTHFQ